MKLTLKLTLIFVLFAAALLIGVNVLGYNVGRTSLKAGAIAELESSAAEKEAALDAWIDEKQADIGSLAKDPAVAEQAEGLLTAPRLWSQSILLHKRLIEEFQTRVTSRELMAVMLLEPQTGEVLASTVPGEEGTFKKHNNYFVEGKLAPYVSPVYFSKELQAPAITVSAPVLSESGKLVGVVAGRVDLTELDEIVLRRSGVHQTDDAFLINTSHQFVTRPRLLSDAVVLKKSVNTELLGQCLQHQNGSLFTNDYQGVPVIAAYRWLPDGQMCLIVKISQAEALSEQQSFGANISLISLATLLVASLVAIGLAHTIIRPIREMQTAAKHYGEGDLRVRLRETRRDELGMLAHEFNTMAIALEQTENQLRDYSIELEKRVAERTAELQQSEMRFKALIEHAPDGIALLGLDGKLRQVTPSTEKILGYTLQDAQSQDPALLTHPDDLPYVLNILNDLIQNPGKVARAEYRFLHKNGTWRWLENTISNLVNEPGIEAIVFNYRDITERKQAQSALAESEEKFKYIFNHSMIGKSITGIDGSLTVNRAFCDMLGYSEEELLTKKWQEITHPEDVDSSNQVTKLLLSGEKDSTRLTKRYLHKNGSVVWADVSVSLRRDREGQPLYFMTALMDMTDRKRTEMQLADALEFNEHILTSSPIGILTYKFTGECLSANAFATQLIGAPAEELKSRNFHQLESWKQSGLYELAKKAMSTRTYTAADIHHISTYGKELWLRAQFVTFKSHGEELLLLTLSDITDRVRAEETLRRFELLSANSRDIILFVRREDGQILDVNAAALNAYGYSREEIMRLTVQDLRADENPQLIFHQIEQSDEGGILFETVHHRKDGSTFPVEISSQGATISGVRTLVSIIRDISERKQAEEALRDSETRYRTLMERSLEAIYVYEADTKHILVTNPAFLDLLGYSASEAQSLTLYDIAVHDQTSINNFLEKIISEGGINMGERLWKRKDGTTCPVEVNANRIKQGEKDLIFVVGRDITERKKAEEALREKERLLSEAQHIGQIGSLSFDLVNGTVQFSDEMYRLLDVSPEKFHHNRQDFLALIYPSDRPIAIKWMDELRTSIPTKELSFRIFRQNGELRYLHCHGGVEFDSEGKPRRFIGTVQDVTERRIAEIQISQQLKRLTALSEIDQAIISGLGQRHTLSVILSQTISQLQVDAADVLLLDSDGQMLRCVAWRGFNTQRIENVQIPVGEKYAGQVVKERRLIQISNLSDKVHNAQFEQMIKEEGFASYTCVPLIITGRVQGVLEVFHRSPFQPYPEWTNFLNALAGQTAIAVDNASLVENLQQSNRDLTEAYDAAIEGWSHAMDLRDHETEGHTKRVTELTLKLARALGIEESKLIHVRRGALLHDMGKLAIPDHILFKPGKLTPEEWEIMQKHPEFAYDMLSPIQYLKPALAIPYFHHERWDGSGYPLGFRGEQIPLEARIFAVIDVWDALLSDRPYRKAWTVERTLEYIRSLAGSHFDPKVVEAFLAIQKN